jgi:hypothetical protein
MAPRTRSELESAWQSLTLRLIDEGMDKDQAAAEVRKRIKPVSGSPAELYMRQFV